MPSTIRICLIVAFLNSVTVVAGALVVLLGGLYGASSPIVVYGLSVFVLAMGLLGTFFSLKVLKSLPSQQESDSSILK